MPRRPTSPSIKFVKPTNNTVVPAYIQIHVEGNNLPRSAILVFRADNIRFASGESYYTAWNSVKAANGYHTIQVSVLHCGRRLCANSVTVFTGPQPKSATIKFGQPIVKKNKHK